jgi:CheY-like chemotaxis protein
MVRDAREGCVRVRTIVQDLRTFSRAWTDAPAPVEPHAVIEGAVKMAQIESQHRARLVRQIDDVPLVLGDQTRLTQVVLNLLLNAAQAIPPGDPQKHEVRVGARDRGAMVEIFVQDDGEGIPAEMLGRIFEPFFTTKPVGLGTGLGLSICRGIVQAHGGTIQVESTVGTGSVFRVLLPVAKIPSGRSQAPSSPPPSSRRSRILIVDDEIRLTTALRAVLSHHEVVLASSGREGLQRMLSGAPFDLILCDVMMPDVSGVGVYEALRRDRPELCDRFVFMSGGAFPEASVGFIAGPAARRLYKPFDAADVERVLAEVTAARGQ